MIIDGKEWVSMEKEFHKRNFYDLLLMSFDHLTENSLVFDIGGYRGDWSSDIYSKYNCNIYVYEPVKTFFNIINLRFSKNKKITAFNFGIYNENTDLDLYLNNDGTSIYKSKDVKNSIKCKMVDVYDILKDSYVDLISINAEGSEYSILTRLLETGCINRVKCLLIQYHYFMENDKNNRISINTDMKNRGFSCTFEYPFYWECWRNL